MKPSRTASGVQGDLWSTHPSISADGRYVAFASKAGALAGNHFATVVEGNENLRELGRRMLWDGAQDISFRES